MITTLISYVRGTLISEEWKGERFIGFGTMISVVLGIITDIAILRILFNL